MSKHHDGDRIEIEDAPAEEGLSESEAAEELDQSSEEKANFTETHPEHARRDQQVMREGGTTD
jgi:hypothetical protein